MSVCIPIKKMRSIEQQAADVFEPTTSETMKMGHNVLKPNLVDPAAIIFPPHHAGTYDSIFKTLNKQAKN